MKKEFSNFVGNVRESFQRVKNDINKLERKQLGYDDSLESIWKNQSEIFQRLERLEEDQRKIFFILANKVIGQKGVGQSDNLVGIKETRELHNEDCILVRSSNPKSKIYFSDWKEAKKQGFKDCICLM